MHRPFFIIQEYEMIFMENLVMELLLVREETPERPSEGADEAFLRLGLWIRERIINLWDLSKPIHGQSLTH